MEYQLTVLSPVHIGTGKNITPFEFIFTDGKFVVMNLEIFFQANPSRANELNSDLERDPLHWSLSEFLAPEECEAGSFHKYSAAVDEMTKAVLQEEMYQANDMDVAECLKTPVEYLIYIPGSSLKGAFRTALAYSIFREDEDAFTELKTRLEKGRWRRSDEAVDELVFLGARKNPKYDFLKVLRFSDSSTSSANEETLEIGKMKILSLTEPRRRETSKQGPMYKQLQQLRQVMEEQMRNPMKPWWIFQEVLKPGLGFTGVVALHERLLQHPHSRAFLGWKAPHQSHFSLEHLVAAANTFALDICQWELRFFEQQAEGIDVTPVLHFYRNLQTRIQEAEPFECYLCLGRGSGWHKMTVGMLLEQDKTFNFRKLRKDLRMAGDRLNFEYPKSRKLLMKTAYEIQNVLGWVQMRFTSPE